MKVASILLAVALTVGTALLLGSFLLRLLGARFRRMEHALFAFVCGSAVLSLMVYALACLRLARPETFVLVALAALFLGLPWGRREPLPRLPGVWRSIWWLASGTFGAVYLVNAMAPEMSPDAMHYHLGLVRQYARDGGFSGTPNALYAALSQGIEMLFLFAYVFGGHSAAAVLHLTFLFVLAAGIVAFGLRFGRGLEAAAAALLVFLSPVVARDATSAYIDIAAATVVFFCFYALVLWHHQRDEFLLPVIGILAGFAYGSKYSTVVCTAGAVAWVVLADRRHAWRVAWTASIFMLPWLIRNGLLYQNPLAPFFNSVFPNPFVTPALEQLYASNLRTYGLPSLWQVPLEVLVRGDTLGGFLGPVFVLLPLALFAIRCPLGRWTLGAAGLMLITYPLNIGTRFLIPALPLLAFSLALAIRRPPLLLAIVALHAVLSCYPMIRRYSSPAAWALHEVPWRAALRIEAEDGYLRLRSAEYRAARYVEERVPPGEQVLCLRPIARSYSDHTLLGWYESTANMRLRNIFLTPLMDGWQPTFLRTVTLPAAATGKVRISQKGSDEGVRWTISEVDPRPAAILASSDSWWLASAMDGNPLTYWREGTSLKNGSWLELLYETTPRKIVLRSEREQARSNISIEFWTGDRWAPIEQEAEFAPDRDWRAQAAETLKSEGVRHILVARGDLAWADLRDHAEAWRMSVVAEDTEQVLVRLD